MKRVVVHHALHPQEGVYRLVHAAEEEHPAFAPNPDFDPEQELTADNPELIEGKAVVHFDHREVVWAADDERWEGREPGDIAAEQRQIVSDAITREVADRERAEAVRREPTHLGGVGSEL